MRISDWSSDGCSSDLAEHGRGEAAERLVAGEAEVEREIVHHFDPNLGDEAALGGERRQPQHDEDDQRAQAAAAKPHHGAEAAGPDQGHAEAEGEAAEDGAGPAEARRSEEHTSELQSLMRISYAVFCLKKKNNTKENIKHNT